VDGRLIAPWGLLLTPDGSLETNGTSPQGQAKNVPSIEKGQRFGLHNLRHSLSNWLVNKGKVEPKTVQSMLRHSKIQTTPDLYTQGDSDEMSTAQQLFADAVDWCGLEKPTQVM
jgi:integrase